jgi:hypothetical protein
MSKPLPELIAFLENYNHWRRGSEEHNHPNPTELGRCIDQAVELLKIMNKPLSRQRFSQLKLKAEGKCELCAKDLDPEHKACLPCLAKRRERLRERKGHKAKVIGGKGRCIKGMDEESDPARAETYQKMSKANYSMTNRVLAEDLQVSQATVARYRKIFAPTIRQQKELEHKMSRADYSLTDKELMFAYGVSQHTVAKYRKIYGSK